MNDTDSRIRLKKRNPPREPVGGAHRALQSFSAAAFQPKIIPSSVIQVMASNEDATIAASWKP